MQSFIKTDPPILEEMGNIQTCMHICSDHYSIMMILPWCIMLRVVVHLSGHV